MMVTLEWKEILLLPTLPGEGGVDSAWLISCSWGRGVESISLFLTTWYYLWLSW